MKRRRIVIQILIRILPLLAIFAASTPARSDSIIHSDQRIHIQYAPTVEKAKHPQTYAWLRQVASALLTVYGEWPKDKFDIDIQSGTSRHSPPPIDSYQQIHKDWIADALKAEDNQRMGAWTQNIAVSIQDYVAKVKSILDLTGRYSTVVVEGGIHPLKEPVTTYIVHLRPEKQTLSDNNMVILE